MHHWHYSDNAPNGPADWAKHYPAGKNQSPIDILIDVCDLHQSTCCGCRLSDELMNKLKLSAQSHPSSHTHPKQRRSHLDSVGNEEYPDGNDELHMRSPSAASSNESHGSASPGPTHQRHQHNDGANRHHHHHHHHHHQQQHNDNGGHHRIESGSLAEVGANSEARLTATTGGCALGAELRYKQDTLYCATNKKIFLGYPRYLNSMQLCNTGHAWQVNMPKELANHTLLSGPPLGDREYRLAQLHCHWGEDCDHGSEHRINGHGFAAEIHFVHWNCSEFESVEEASKHKHGLAVLAVFVQALEDERYRNKHLDKITKNLSKIIEPNSSIQVHESRLDLKKLFPSNRWNYATYDGSLTTPPLSEVVNWIVFLQPIQCSQSQIDQFRQITCPTGNLVKNCRPLQPLNNRTVSIWTHSHSHIN